MNKELKCNIKFNRESKRVYKIELVSKWSSGKQFFTWELNINTFELLGISKIDKNINNEYNNDLFKSENESGLNIIYLSFFIFSYI